jgi:hypothetical protein
VNSVTLQERNYRFHKEVNTFQELVLAFEVSMQSIRNLVRKATLQWKLKSNFDNGKLGVCGLRHPNGVNSYSGST